MTFRDRCVFLLTSKRETLQALFFVFFSRFQVHTTQSALCLKGSSGPEGLKRDAVGVATSSQDSRSHTREAPLVSRRSAGPGHWVAHLLKPAQRAKFSPPCSRRGTTETRTRTMDKMRAVLVSFWGVTVSSRPQQVLRRLEESHSFPG